MRLPQSALLRGALAASLAVTLVVTGTLTAAAFINRSPRAAQQAATASDPHAGHGNMPGAPTKAEANAIIAQAALRGSEFRADCLGTHLAGDDPIVKPNQFGASHIHQFIGNFSTNAASTYQSLMAGATNCNPSVDKTPYWVPALYKNGVHVAPESVIVYYQGITQGSRAEAYPPNFRMVIGNAAATSPDQNPVARWNCYPHAPSSTDFMNCAPGTKLQTYLNFPTCWNGQLDSANHTSHVAWAVGDSCPGSHPRIIPRVQFVITYPVNGTGLSLGGTRNGVNVTTAPGYTFHGDFLNVWNQAELERRVDICIRQGYICGNDGCPIGGGGPACSPNPGPQPPPPPPPGPQPPSPPPGNRDAYSPIQAESYNQQSGVTVQSTSDVGGGQNISTIRNGDWIMLQGVNFGSGSATQFRGRVASGAGGGVSGLVEVRLDSRTSPVVASFAIANTGGWQSWQTVPTGMSPVSGTHNVYITFTSGQPSDYVNLNWIQFGR